LSVIRSFIFFNIKYEYNITLKELLGTDVEVFKKEYTHNIAE